MSKRGTHLEDRFFKCKCWCKISCIHSVLTTAHTFIPQYVKIAELPKEVEVSRRDYVTETWEKRHVSTKLLSHQPVDCNEQNFGENRCNKNSTTYRRTGYFAEGTVRVQTTFHRTSDNTLGDVRHWQIRLNQDITYRSSIPIRSKVIRQSMARSLMYKMNEIGYPKNKVQLIASYVEGRIFRVKIGNKISTFIRSEAGMPQGAVLSSQAYFIYTPDIPKPDYSMDRTIMGLIVCWPYIYCLSFQQPALVINKL